MRWLTSHISKSTPAIVLVCLLSTSCGTGIEVTEHVTDKDVQRVLEKDAGHQNTVSLEAYKDSLAAWKTGKRFWVADDQVREILVHSSDYDKDTLHLARHILLYQSSGTDDLYADDNDLRRMTIVLKDSETGAIYSCLAGKAAEARRPGFTIPMLIDLDMVDHVARQVVGRDFYINTPIWYDRDSEQMIDGRHFIKVHIDSVLPGNAVLPLRVLFTTADTGEKAMLWMNNYASTMHGRDFDALFTATDPRLSYPLVTDANWERITRGQVAEGMTKEECRLALGNPRNINERPDQAGMREYWYYDGGAYLFFVDGLLSQFRK